MIKLTLKRGRKTKTVCINSKGKTVRRNPGNVEATELKLFIDNDGVLYKQKTTPIQQNLSKKFLKGTYDHAKSVKLWMHLADNGAKKYAREYASPTEWNTIFPRSTRLAVAKDLADEWYAELKAGNLNLPPGRNKSDKYYVLHKDGSIAGTRGTKQKAIRLLKDLGATDILMNNPKRRRSRR